MAEIRNTEFQVGAEKKIIYIDVTKPSPIAQATVNVVGVFSTKQEVKEQKITNFEDLAGVETDTDLYKIVRAVFVAGGQEVVVYGKNVTDGGYKALFDGVENDWFGTVTDETDIQKIVAISKEIAAREKMLFAQVPKGAEVAGAAKAIKEIAEDTTALFFNKNDEYTAASVAGYTISKLPGSTLIANKDINGATYSGLTGAEQGIVEKAWANYIAPMKGQPGLANGTNVKGEPIDFIHCAKALKFRLEEDFTALLKNSQKLGFEPDDLMLVKTTALERIQQFEGWKALKKGKTVVSLPASIPDNDELNGILTGVVIDTYYVYGAKEMRIQLRFLV